MHLTSHFLDDYFKYFNNSDYYDYSDYSDFFHHNCLNYTQINYPLPQLND